MKGPLLLTLLALLALLAVFAMLAALAVACGGDDDEVEGGDAAAPAASSGTATATANVRANEASTGGSADGLAVLTVPEGALPAGVAASTLSLELEQGRDEAAFAVYRLEPDGLVPSAPLTLTVTIEAGADEAVALLVTDLDGALIEDAAAITELAPRDDGRLDVVIAVQHFSRFILGRTANNLRIDIEPLEDQPVGATFTVRARIVRDLSGFDYESPLVKGVLRWTEDDLVAWSGAGLWRASPSLRPSEALNPGTSFPGGSYQGAAFAVNNSVVIVEQAFACGSAGDFSIAFRLSGTMVFTPKVGGSTLFTSPDSDPAVWNARCLGAATPTATDTPTPTSTPLPTPTETATPDPTQSATPEPTGTSMPAAGSVTVQVLVLDGLFFPADQFRTAGPDACNGPHYHASMTVFSLEGATAQDPNSTGCGFGKVSDVEKRTVTLTAEEWRAYEDLFTVR